MGHSDSILLLRLCPLLHEALCKSPGKIGLESISWLLYWVWGVAFLSFLEQSSSLWHRKWAAFLALNGTSSKSYTKVKLKTTNACYVKFSNRHSKAYVGSTSQTILARESTRRRKYRQCGRSHAEPAIVWWKRTRTFFEFCPIVIMTFSSINAAEEFEVRTINIRQPELNTPLVQRLLSRKSRQPVSFHRHSLKNVFVQPRLLKRARKLRQSGQYSLLL